MPNLNPRASPMLTIVSFLVNAVLTFALGLCVAHVLGPELFGRYSVALSVALAGATASFEWLRLSALRFYSGRTRAEDPGLRATLTVAYAATVLVLVVLAAGAIALGVDVGLPAATLAAATAAGIAAGLFDYRASLARALFLDRTYAASVLAKNGLAFALTVGGAWLTHDPAVVLLGAALSGIVALGAAGRALRDPAARPGAARRAVLASFARYALPLVAANLVYQLIPVAGRFILAARFGYAEAGYYSLAADLGARLFLTLGSALDILLFQLALRVNERQGATQAGEQVMRNAGVVAALLLPFAAGFWLVLPGFEALLVPEPFRGHFAAYMGPLIPAFLCLALIQFALNPVFQLRARTLPTVGAALVAAAAGGALLPLASGAGPVGVAYAQAGGLAAALVLLGGLAAGSHRLPWRDLAWAALATGAMALAVLGTRRAGSDVVALAVAVTVGVPIYAIVALGADVAGLRGLALRVGRRPGTA